MSVNIFLVLQIEMQYSQYYCTKRGEDGTCGMNCIHLKGHNNVYSRNLLFIQQAT